MKQMEMSKATLIRILAFAMTQSFSPGLPLLCQRIGDGLPASGLLSEAGLGF
jgi:hypothetical protein